MKQTYSYGGVLLIFISIMGFYGQREAYRVQQNGEVVQMELVRINGPCRGTKVKNRGFFRYKEKIYSKRISTAFCENHRIGDLINIRYLKDSEKILFPSQNMWIQDWSSIFLLLIGISFIVFSFVKKD